MKEHPILFSTPMVQAILEGRKTMTRRIVKPQPAEDTEISFMPNSPLEWESTYNEVWKPWKWDTEEGESVAKFCPYGQVGDILWVRETWQFVDFGCEPEERGYVYKASENGQDWADNDESWKWKPSIFMPKEACRIYLEITGIKVEQINEITSEDALAEGIEPDLTRGDPAYKNYHDKTGFTFLRSPYESFQSLWGSINGSDSWYNNPWVWVIKFKRI